MSMGTGAVLGIGNGSGAAASGTRAWEGNGTGVSVGGVPDAEEEFGRAGSVFPSGVFDSVGVALRLLSKAD